MGKKDVENGTYDRVNGTEGREKMGLKEERKWDRRKTENGTEGRQKMGQKEERKRDRRRRENGTE